MARAFVVRDEIRIRAPIERSFALSVNVELVQRILRLRPVRGRTTGSVCDGDTIQWRGWKFCLPQTHESFIEAFRPPVFFRDRMLKGRFAGFAHDHSFASQPDGSVLLRDEVRFTMRWGLFGELAGTLLVLPHVRKLLRQRFELLRTLAEGEGWRKYVT